jgi:hypothetical protein
MILCGAQMDQLAPNTANWRKGCLIFWKLTTFNLIPELSRFEQKLKAFCIQHLSQKFDPIGHPAEHAYPDRIT